jgi:LCP family protein required for cell wall assembly
LRLTKPKRKRPLWRRIMRWIALLLAILLGYGVFLLVYLVANINKVDAMPADQIGNTPGAVTLIVGSDERTNDPTSGSRTDTIMLMVDPLFGAPTLVSIPRDSWVEIPGEGNGKINSAFSIGGPQLLIETIELNTGLHVDHYMEIGFEGVVWLADAVGGVRLCIDFDVDDANSGLVMQAGCSVLEGQQALAFVRMRYSDPEGDLGRIARQQQYIESLVKTVLQPQVFLNPFTMVDVMGAAADALTVDEDTGVFNLTRFGWGVMQIGRGAGSLTTVPVADTSAWRGGQSVVLWDDAAAEQLFDSLGA